MKKSTLRIITAVVIFAMLFSVMAVPAFADKETSNLTAGGGSSLTADIISSSSEYDYVAYKADNKDFVSAKTDIVLNGADFSSEKESGVVKHGEYEGEKNVIVWESQTGSVNYVFDVPADALYNITFVYKALPGSERDLDFGVMIDGEYPFVAANAFELPRMWVDATDFREDDYGNQFAPEQVPFDGFTKKSVYDLTGASVYPFEFAFKAGKHTVTVVTNSEKWVISKIILSAPESNIASYAQVKEEYNANGYTPASADSIFVEGESAWVKSTRSLIPYADNASPDVTPSSATLSLINYIGSTNWKLPNEEIKWVVKVEKPGLYKLGFKYKQDQVVNGFSYRHLKIDGKTPFAECANIKFDYTISWDNFVFGDENGAYEFYLTEGEHVISLAGTMGELSDSYYKLKSVVEKIGSLYLDIVMITSESPDSNRDYELFRAIPDFEKRLTEYKEELNSLAETMQELSGKKGSSYIAAMNNTARVLNSMLNNKYTAQNYVSDYYSNYTTLSSWLYSMQEMALSLDVIELAPADKDFNFKKVGFFKNLHYGFQRFFVSFSDSYSKISVVKDEGKTIRIWVNWGRDQSQVLNNLINESFLPYAEKELGYPVSVNLELVNADIIKGMLSGNAPDLSLQLPRSTPVNLAMRGALVDLTQFEDYEETIKNFGESASIPYEYGDGVYALPDTQAFYIMFYRTDILKKLNLKVPETWDEFLALTAVLQRNNMNSYITYNKIAGAATVDTGVGGLNLFPSILMQNGGQIYNDERNRSTLDSATSLTAFTFWTDMHTKYKVPVQASFYDRFRIGTIPIGIANYTQYTTFAEAAPEITGRWGISLIPGFRQEDGTINRTISGSGTGCSILATSKVQKEAWTFLKWWTSENTQTRYNTNVESILGTVSRITTANLKAFENMSWERKDLEILLEQRESIVEVPEVPGSYYLSRSLDQAFWAVINATSAPKDSLSRWSLEANNEIRRKIAEYS